MQNLWHRIKLAIRVWEESDCASLAASLSFHLLLSLSPLLILLTFGVNLFLDQQNVQDFIVEQVTEIVGTDVAEVVDFILTSVGEREGRNQELLLSLIGLGILVFAASTFLGQVYKALNLILHSSEEDNLDEGTSRVGLYRILRQRLAALLMLVGLLAYFFISIILTTIIRSAGSELAEIWPTLAVLARRLDLSSYLSLSLVFLLIVIMYRFVPLHQMPWFNIIIGAAFTTILFSVGMVLFQLFINRVTLSSVYGAAASLMVLLIWVYYTSHIFLAGAVFTYVFASS